MGRESSTILAASSFFMWVWIAVAPKQTINGDGDSFGVIHAADDLNSASASPPALVPAPGGGDPPMLPRSESPGRQQVEDVMMALRRAGVYGAIAGAIDDLKLDQLPQDATMFVPNDDALGVFSLPPTKSLSLMQYHVTNQLLSFRDLLQLPTGARIPTLLSGSSILITRSDPTLYTLDGVEIISANLYMDGSVAVHGINGVLNSTFYGGEFTAAEPAPSDMHNNLSAPAAQQPTDAAAASPNDSILSSVLGTPVQEAFDPIQSSATPLFACIDAFLSSLIVAAFLTDFTDTMHQLINTV